MGIYYEFLWQQHFNQIISLFSKPLQCLKNQMLCFFNLPVVKYSLHHLILPFSCEKLIAFICYRVFLLETMDTTKKQVMRGLQICKE